MEEQTQPETVLVAPDPAAVLDEFNNLVDAFEQAASFLTMAQEDVKQKKAAVSTIEQAIRDKAREMRQGARELPLFSNEAES